MGVRGVTFLTALLAIAACRTSDPAIYTRDGRLLQELPPLPFRLAIDPIGGEEVLDATLKDARYRFRLDARQVQHRIVERLRAETATNGVVALEVADLAGAQDARADLLLRARVSDAPVFARKGRTARAWVSTGLWFLGWYPGLKVEDTSYTAHLSFDIDLVNPYDGMTLDTFRVASEEMDLTFMERNPGLKGSIIQTFILPPMFARDHPDRTSHVLSERVVDRLASRIAGYLKQDFSENERDRVGEVRLLSPRDGSEVEGSIEIDARVRALEPISSCALYLNDSREPLLEVEAAQLEPTTQRRGSIYEVPVRASILLAPGQNSLAFEFRIAGRLTSRTFLFRSTAAPIAR